MSDTMFREFFLGFIKIHILHHAEKEAVYGAYLIEELASHGYEIGPGTIYPTLHQMEKRGYLKKEEKLVMGKVRKYYHITPEGKKALTEVRAKIEELVSEIL
ncbi:MAG: PadR family transcriptional regulator [Firmicutes bacterium]|nr:PadR family transcriptional regulator [Bacillota bacterium]MCL5780636.1 PadR family transcriptional regulator [Bacillota bacterium]